jgi:hypothetical protein
MPIMVASSPVKVKPRKTCCSVAKPSAVATKMQRM